MCLQTLRAGGVSDLVPTAHTVVGDQRSDALVGQLLEILGAVITRIRSDQ